MRSPVLEKIKKLCLSDSKQNLIPRKVLLGIEYMAEVYKIIEDQRKDQKDSTSGDSILKSKGKEVSFEDFLKQGALLNLGSGLMKVELSDKSSKDVQVKSITSDQLLKQAERDSLKYIAEENKLRKQGREE